MIISASRRTDIPAFYGEWFMRRVQAGRFLRVNPFNRAQRSHVSLAPEDVDLFVFWTKNPSPFLARLAELEAAGYRSVLYMTLNDYPAVLEPRLPTLAARIEAFRASAGLLGPERVLWRYDPVVVGPGMEVDYHLERFGHLARALAGSTRRVTVSLMEFYGKVRRRMESLPPEKRPANLRLPDRSEELARLASGLSSLARESGLDIRSCSEKIDLSAWSIPAGACLDRELFEKLFDRPMAAPKDRSQRPECLCCASVDMGMYDTCRFACLYCYACRDHQACLRNGSLHDPAGESLLPV